MMKKCTFNENDILTYLDGGEVNTLFKEHLNECTGCYSEVEKQRALSMLVAGYYKKAMEDAPAINIWAMIEDKLPERRSIKERIAEFFSPVFAVPRFRYAAVGVLAAAVAFFTYNMYTPPQPAEFTRGVEINYVESNKAQVMIIDSQMDQNNKDSAVIWIFEEESSKGNS